MRASIHSKHLHAKRRDEIAENHWKHHDAKGAACHDEEDTYELRHEFLAHQLAEHREGVERELDPAGWRGQVWFHVRLSAGFTNCVSCCLSAWDDSEVDADLDVFSILFGDQEESAVIAELNVCAGGLHLFLQVCLVEHLGQLDGLLSETDVVEEWLQIECPLADVVILLEDIEVPGLEDQQVGILLISLWTCLDVVENSVVERSLSILATIVSVGAPLIVVVDIGP